MQCQRRAHPEPSRLKRRDGASGPGTIGLTIAETEGRRQDPCEVSRDDWRPGAAGQRGWTEFQLFEVRPLSDAVWAFADREAFDVQCHVGSARRLPITLNCFPQGRLSEEGRSHCAMDIRTLTACTILTIQRCPKSPTETKNRRCAYRWRKVPEVLHGLRDVGGRLDVCARLTKCHRLTGVRGQ